MGGAVVRGMTDGGVSGVCTCARGDTSTGRETGLFTGFHFGIFAIVFKTVVVCG